VPAVAPPSFISPWSARFGEFPARSFSVLESCWCCSVYRLDCLISTSLDTSK
jgi:hypothetical protein